MTREVRDILAYAAGAPAVEINTFTNSVIPPDTTGWPPEEVAKVAAKIADLESRIAAALAHAGETDADLARMLTAATGGEPDIPTGEHGTPGMPMSG